MSLFEALILGLVQGFTEFLPVSSSAHLKFAKWLLGIADGQHLQYFDLICHGGTLFALIFYLWKDILQVLRSIQSIAVYSLAILPLVPAYFFLKPLRTAASHPQYLGYCLMATAAFLFLASKARCKTHGPSKTSLSHHFAACPPSSTSSIGREKLSQNHRFSWIWKFCGWLSRKKAAARSGEFTDLKWKDVLCIGVMQTMALIPGISRSGSTISAARFCGWSWMDAARFSFLLAVPTVLGGEVLETLKLLEGSSEAAGALPWSCYVGGFAASFGFGLLGVRFMFRIYERGNVRPFAWYCLGAGLLALVIFHA